MKKLKLDDLAVESFPTAEFPTDRGTVVGRYDERPSQDIACTMPGQPECIHTAAEACLTYGYTCFQSCMWYCRSKVPCDSAGCGNTVQTSVNCGGGGTVYGDYTCDINCVTNRCEIE
jgi:hypothetical protein